MNRDICMETTHGRKGKTKTSFKGVLNKVLVSGLILATVAGISTPAFAADVSLTDSLSNTINTQYGESTQSIISNIRNTISTVNQMKANGSVSDSVLKDLASQLYQLEKSVNTSGGSVSNDVIAVIEEAEKSVNGLSNASEVTVALGIVKDSLGIASITATNKAEPNPQPTSFRDVVQGDSKKAGWAYDAIMAMTNQGLFSGKENYGDGTARFAPEDTMSRAEFITVVVRTLYKDELSGMPEAKPWYQNAQTLAIKYGLLESHEQVSSDLTQPMTRQEMAMVLVRAAEKKGETPSQLIDKSQIADYNKVDEIYRYYVIQSYSMGLLCGQDKQGTYNPTGTLNRASAATVLYRLVEPSARQAVDFNTPTTETPQGSQKWVEGQSHNEPKAGDIVVKNGKEIVLQEKFGLLGFGQGVDIYTGTTINGVSAKVGMASWYDQTPFIKSDLTGEVYSSQQWVAVKKEIRPVGLVGDRDGEVYNVYYKWSSKTSDWEWIGPNIR